MKVKGNLNHSKKKGGGEQSPTATAGNEHLQAAKSITLEVQLFFTACSVVHDRVMSGESLSAFKNRI